MKKTLSLIAIFLMAVVVAIPPAAHAVPTLSLWDGFAAPVIVVDQGFNDANLSVGAVTYVGAVGATWWLNVTTGITAPFIGGPADAAMDLNSVNVNSIGLGSLTIMFSEVGFTLPVPNDQATMSIGGTTQGSIKYDTYFDNGNGLFALTGLIGTLGPYGPVAFSGSLGSNILTNNPFSLTQVVTINHAKAAATSFNASLDVVPLPGSVLLLGSGLLGILGLGFRRKIKG